MCKHKIICPAGIGLFVAFVVICVCIRNIIIQAPMPLISSHLLCPCERSCINIFINYSASDISDQYLVNCNNDCSGACFMPHFIFIELKNVQREEKWTCSKRNWVTENRQWHVRWELMKNEALWNGHLTLLKSKSYIMLHNWDIPMLWLDKFLSTTTAFVTSTSLLFNHMIFIS